MRILIVGAYGTIGREHVADGGAFTLALRHDLPHILYEFSSRMCRWL